ncbi:MAG: CHASE domain-containing protein, partial [Burkholderiaceae bacterium]|nr:CHASE domain-containing protein [Burkholderiaceae bacterium]
MRLNRLTLPAFTWTMGTLFISVMASALLTWRHTNSNSREAQSAFETHSLEVVDRLSARMRLYEYGLRGARGTVLTAGENGINYHLFQQYGKTRDVDAEFPGARGFGFVRRVPRSQTERYLRTKRADDRPDFAIQTLTEHEGERFIIEYIEPMDRSRAAVGLDIGSESNRRQAAISAIQTGKATITGPITLLQASGDPQRSVLFLLPIYRGGATPESIEARELSAFGWSYAPLSLSEVLADFNIAQLHYDLAITDISDPAQPASVFNSLKKHTEKKVGLNQTLEREVYGRLWRIELSGRPEFVDNLHLLSSKAVLGGSLLTSLLLSLLVGAVQVGRERQRKSIVQQAQLATIVENSADAIVGESNDGHVIIWNRAAERLFGYTHSEAMGQRMIERMTPVTERGKETELVRQVHANAEITPTDAGLLTRAGALVPVSITRGTIRGNHGEIIGIARLMRDISERLRTEHAMRELAASLDQQVKDRTAELETARHDLQTVLDSVPSMIGYWDTNLLNRVANKAYGDWFGVEPSSLLGKPMAQLLGAEIFERNRPYLEG